MDPSINSLPTLADLLKGKSPDKFTPAQLSNKAHWRWDRDQFYEAFLLFDASRQRAADTGRPTSERSAANRAAVTLSLSGVDRGEAVSRLNAILLWYQSHTAQSIDDDRHFAEWAATCLLRDCFRHEPENFPEQFFDLQEQCRVAGRDYPSIHPQQVEIAEMAYTLKAKAVMQALLPILHNRRPMPRPLRASLKTWELWCQS